MAGKIKVQRGTTHSIGVTYKENGSAADIRGATILFTVRDSEHDVSDTDDSEALISKDVTSHSDPTNGVSSIVLTPSDTRIAIGKHYYSIKIDKNSDDSEVYEIAEGRFEVDGDPTNRVVS